MTSKLDGKPLKREGDEIWTCQDGRILYVSEMSEEHVRATLNMILRQRRIKQRLKHELMSLMEIAMSDEPCWDSKERTREFSPEHKNKLSIARKSQIISEERISKMANSLKGSEHSRKKRKAIVNGVEFLSTKQAFIALGLPLEKCTTFRMSMAESMEGTFIFEDKAYHFILEYR
jgi:hypothetical protein